VAKGDLSKVVLNPDDVDVVTGLSTLPLFIKHVEGLLADGHDGLVGMVTLDIVDFAGVTTPLATRPPTSCSGSSLDGPSIASVTGSLHAARRRPLVAVTGLVVRPPSQRSILGEERGRRSHAVVACSGLVNVGRPRLPWHSAGSTTRAILLAESPREPCAAATSNQGHKRDGVVAAEPRESDPVTEAMLGPSSDDPEQLVGGRVANGVVNRPRSPRCRGSPCQPNRRVRQRATLRRVYESAGSKDP